MVVKKLASSLLARVRKVASELPVPTARRVSKLLPLVVRVTRRETGAVQVNQMDFPPLLPAMGGSPASFVAPMLVAVM